MTLADFLLKKRSKTVDQARELKKRQDRADRRTHRHNLIAQRRNMSPVEPTPAKKSPVKSSRKDQLIKWKEERDRKNAELKKNVKPIFKWSKVAASADISEANVFGKRVPLSTSKSGASSSKNFIVPSSTKSAGMKSAASTNKAKMRLEFNGSSASKDKRTLGGAYKAFPPVSNTHKGFKPPETIRPLTLESSSNGRAKGKLEFHPSEKSTSTATKPKKQQSKNPDYNITTRAKAKGMRRNTRSMGGEDFVNINTPKKSGRKKRAANKIEKGMPDNTNRTADVEGATKTPGMSALSQSALSQSSTQSPNTASTPQEQHRKPIAYVSPFVTLSRGKTKARDEFHQRKSVGGLSATSPELTGHQASANYFQGQLNDETQRIVKLVDVWENYKVDEDLPEEPCCMINTAVGQAKLLMSKKMKQFQELIISCREQNTDPLVTAKDLHGYWDVLDMQVGNIDRRFENLTRLRANDWVEVLSAKKPVPKQKKVNKKQSKAMASKGLREAILAARGNINKGSNKSISIEMVGDSGTPGRSILKSAKKSVRSTSKVVFFKEQSEENNLNFSNTTHSLSAKKSRKSSVPRRSALKGGSEHHVANKSEDDGKRRSGRFSRKLF